jgi:intracellular septation protein A
MFKTFLLLGLEIMPLLVFFTLGQYLPFLQAIEGYIGATVIVMITIWHIQKRVSYLALIFSGVIIVSGSLSIWFSNPDILLITDTIYYLTAAVIIFVLTQFRINVFKLLFAGTFSITDTGWRILNNRWMIALAVAGISNEIVRQLATPQDWLVFQIVRTALFIVFATYQFTLTKKHRLPSATAWGVAITK